ncbi:MAG: radical SAM protein [Clostridia bacterium]|nr:radical SAM protein [Clostridia bacterium]
MPHRNIPIFIPHLGCPNQCVFCNQRSISGCREFCEGDVEHQIDQALQTIPTGAETEIAFFGGSFTGIDRELMLRLLDTAERYVRAGRVTSVRLSTRPDYIDAEILAILSRYSVRVIELGLQSMDDTVLRKTKRGHTAKQARDACRAVKDAGFALVGQMMIGLPESTAESELAAAQEIVALGADAARIYPTVVFYGTPLCDMTQNGEYTPLSVTEAVRRSAAVLRVFEKANVPCIRIGLCATEELVSPEAVMAGPNHPALGELVWNEYCYQEILNALERASLRGGEVLLRVPERAVSKVVGQRRCNIERLLRETDTRVCKTVGEKQLREVIAESWQPVRKQEEEQPCI